jgi:hypothetical protein
LEQLACMARAPEGSPRRRNAVGQGIRIETVVQRVVPVLGIEAYFDVIFVPAVAGQNAPDLLAEVPLDLQHQSTDPSLGVCCFISEYLFSVGIQAGARFATPHRSEDRNPSKQPAFGKPWGTKEFGAIDPNGVCVTFQE